MEFVLKFLRTFKILPKKLWNLSYLINGEFFCLRARKLSVKKIFEKFLQKTLTFCPFSRLIYGGIFSNNQFSRKSCTKRRFLSRLKVERYLGREKIFKKFSKKTFTFLVFYTYKLEGFSRNIFLKNCYQNCVYFCYFRRL